MGTPKRSSFSLTLYLNVCLQFSLGGFELDFDEFKRIERLKRAQKQRLVRPVGSSSGKGIPAEGSASGRGLATSSSYVSGNESGWSSGASDSEGSEANLGGASGSAAAARRVAPTASKKAAGMWHKHVGKVVENQKAMKQVQMSEEVSHQGSRGRHTPHPGTGP